VYRHTQLLWFENTKIKSSYLKVLPSNATALSRTPTLGMQRRSAGTLGGSALGPQKERSTQTWHARLPRSLKDSPRLNFPVLARTISAAFPQP